MHQSPGLSGLSDNTSGLSQRGNLKMQDRNACYRLIQSVNLHHDLKRVLAKASDIARIACLICHTWITIQPHINLCLLRPHCDCFTCAVDDCDETGLLDAFKRRSVM